MWFWWYIHVVVNNNQVNQSNSVTNDQHSNISIVDEQQERTWDYKWMIKNQI